MDKKTLSLVVVGGIVVTAVVLSMNAIQNGGFLRGQLTGAENNFTIIDNLDDGPRHRLERGPGATIIRIGTSYGNNPAHLIHQNPKYRGISHWTFRDLAPGEYEVWVTWMENRAFGTASYEVWDDVTSIKTTPLPQNVAPVGMMLGGRPWQLLGTFSIVSGTLEVMLPPPTQPRFVYVDAVAIKPVQVASQCGNGKVEQGEECDDVNGDNADFCSAACTLGQAENIRITLAEYSGDPRVIEWEDFLVLQAIVWSYNVLGQREFSEGIRTDRLDMDGSGFITEQELQAVTDALGPIRPPLIDKLYEIIVDEMLDQKLHPTTLVIDDHMYEEIMRHWINVLISGDENLDQDSIAELDLNGDGDITSEDYFMFSNGMRRVWENYREYTEMVIDKYMGQK